METLGIIVLVLVGFLTLRFFRRAKSMADTANEVINTANKFKTAMSMARQKVGNLATVGPLTPAKETYIAYLYEVGVATSVADNLPKTMCQAFVMEEARAISDLPASEDSEALIERCRESKNGDIGSKMGAIDGAKLADRFSSQPYFVELDKWLTRQSAT